jgi:hypothetical protein
MQRRLTIAEESHLRAVCNVLAGILDPCKEIKGIQQSIYDMLTHNTTDGRPYVEPELTDEDAKARPWVMVRDSSDHKWIGPHVLIGKTSERFGFVAALPDFSESNGWQYCRRATPEEIAAAGLVVR